MTTIRTTFTLDESLADQARRLGVNVSAAAREGVATSIRRIGAEVALDHRAIGLERESAVNCDGLHTVTQTSLTRRIGQLDDTTMNQVCSAVSYALGC